MEYVTTGNLDDFKNKNDLSLEDAATYIRQICLGLNHMHKSGFIHKDLKPENVLVETYVNSEGETEKSCKITDFGSSCPIKKGKAITEREGTVPFMAPEVVCDKGLVQSDKVDVWSVGVIAYHLLSGDRAPFYTLNQV